MTRLCTFVVFSLSLVSAGNRVGAADKTANEPTGPINVYTIPRATEFGLCEQRFVREGNETSRFKRDLPAEGHLPLRLSRESGEIAFWIRGPKSLGDEEKMIEIEPIPHVVCGEASPIPVPKGATPREALDICDQYLALMNKNAVIAPGTTHRYLVSSNAPSNVFLLYLPKNASLGELQRLYPKERNFDCPDDKVRTILTGSAIATEAHSDYVDLLHRGGAIVVPRKGGKKFYLTVQPNREIAEIPID